MPTPTRSANSTATEQGSVRIENVQLVDVGVEAEQGGLIQSQGLAPDAYKAYVEFDICHTLPEVLGPVQSGNFIGFTPETMAISHGSLLHQQFNIRHLLRSYSPADEKGEKKIAKDRIIGCVVATSYPKKPMNGWVAGQAYPVRAVATIFKLADGVARLLGDHLTSKETQSVSIETITPFGNIGIHRPSTGETWPILGEMPKEVVKAIKEVPGGVMPNVGKVDGEQLLVIYGIGQPISLRGVGMTANPAERAARIVGVQAQKLERDADTLFLVTAEQQDQEMIGAEVLFKSTNSKGTVRAVTTEGVAELCGMRIAASKEDPVLLIELVNGRCVLQRCSLFR